MKDCGGHQVRGVGCLWVEGSDDGFVEVYDEGLCVRAIQEDVLKGLRGTDFAEGVAQITYSMGVVFGVRAGLNARVAHKEGIC